MWELSELDNIEGLHSLIALLAVFIEQTAIDGGRYQVACLLTGLNPPAFNIPEKNTARLAEEPFALLAVPRWIAALVLLEGP